MPSSVDVVNVSLRMLGATRITSLTEGTNPANVANDIYTETLKDLLRHPWNFATKGVKLAQSATAPAFRFDHAYPLPSDWVYTISVHGDNIGNSTIVYGIEEVASQTCIVTSHDEVYLLYTYYASDTNLMPADFRRAFSSALARDMSLALTGSNTVYQEMAEQARRDLTKAKGTDGVENYPVRRPRGTWVNSRNGWRVSTDDQIT